MTNTDNTDSKYTCSSNVTTEQKFSDSFVDQKTADIVWSGAEPYETLTVSDIATQFNNGRAGDSTISGSLVMPSQTDWDKMSDSEKGLFLVNSERCARGVRPFEAIELNLVSSPTQYYADYLAVNNVFSHTADGSAPEERLESMGGVIVGTNADFFKYTENLAYFSGATNTATHPDISEPVARSVYGWLYADSVDGGSGYGHRKLVLATGMTENSGVTGKEGLVSFATAYNQGTHPSDATYLQTTAFVVMNIFDPNENWSMGNIKEVEINASK